MKEWPQNYSITKFPNYSVTKFPMKRVVAALIWKNGKVLICQRTRHQVMPLKWEFPGGKIEEGEQPRDALRRELGEELGITPTTGHQIARIGPEYPKGGVGGILLEVFH